MFSTWLITQVLAIKRGTTCASARIWMAFLIPSTLFRPRRNIRTSKTACDKSFRFTCISAAVHPTIGNNILKTKKILMNALTFCFMKVFENLLLSGSRNNWLLKAVILMLLCELAPSADAQEQGEFNLRVKDQLKDVTATGPYP